MYSHILVSVTCAIVVSGMDLQCYNDYDQTMDCHLSSVKSNCSEYNLDVKRSDNSYSCIFKDIMRSRDVICSCSISMEDIIISEELTATVGNETFRISIKDSIKPKRPTITEVKPTKNGNFRITWETHYENLFYFSSTLTTELMYKKRGNIDGVSQNTSSTSFEILGTDLEPNTEYGLIIRTYTGFSNLFSDSSQMWVFTTGADSSSVFKMVIIVSSIVAISLTCCLFWCFIILKNKCRDTLLKYPSPALLNIDIKEPWLLSPSKIPLCPISVNSPDINWTEGKQVSFQDGSGQMYESNGDQDVSSQSYAITCPTSETELTPGNSQIAKIQAELVRLFPNLSAISVEASTSQSYMNVPNSKPINSLDLVTESPTLILKHALPCSSGYNSNETKVTFLPTFFVTNQDPKSFSEEDSSYQPCTNTLVSSSPVEDSLTWKTKGHTNSLSPCGDDYQALQSLQQHNSCQSTLNHSAEEDGMFRE